MVYYKTKFKFNPAQFLPLHLPLLYGMRKKSEKVGVVIECNDALCMVWRCMWRSNSSQDCIVFDVGTAELVVFDTKWKW